MINYLLFNASILVLPSMSWTTRSGHGWENVTYFVYGLFTYRLIQDVFQVFCFVVFCRTYIVNIYIVSQSKSHQSPTPNMALSSTYALVWPRYGTCGAGGMLLGALRRSFARYWRRWRNWSPLSVLLRGPSRRERLVTLLSAPNWLTKRWPS